MAPRMRASVIMPSKFEPKRGPPGGMNSGPRNSLKPPPPTPRPAPPRGGKMPRGPSASQPIEPRPNPKPNPTPPPPNPKNETYAGAQMGRGPKAPAAGDHAQRLPYINHRP